MNALFVILKFYLLDSVRYFQISFNVVKALLAQNTVFNRELAYTYIWYKTVGLHSLQKSKYLYVDFFKIAKPFHFLKITYYFPTLINQKLVNFIFVFIVLISAILRNDFILVGLLASPLFAIYFLGETKPERIFFAILWVCLLLNDHFIAAFLYPFSLFSITTLVTNLNYIFFFSDNIVGILWALLLLAIMIFLLFKNEKLSNLSFVLTEISDPLAKRKTTFKSRLKHTVSKSQLLTLALLIVIFFKESEPYVISGIFIIAINNVVVRFCDTSTERRVFITVLLTYYLQTQDWTVFLFGLFLPFNLFSHIPTQNFDEMGVKNLDCIIKQVGNYRDMIKSGSSTLVEYTGYYDMDNKARYLWYIYEYAFIGKTHVFPHIYLKKLSTKSEWLTYRNLKDATAGPTEYEFIKKFDYIISYSSDFEKVVSKQNYTLICVINNDELEHFDVEHIKIWKR